MALPIIETPQAERLISLIETEMPPVPAYVAPAILPLGGQLCFGSHAKAGKSWVILEFARALAAGEPVFNHPDFLVASPVRVLLVEAELGKFGLRERAAKVWHPEEVRRQGKRINNLFYLSKTPELQIDTMSGRKLLRSILDDVQPHVIMLDPIGRMHGLEENDATEVAKLFKYLDEIQKEYRHNNMALILSQHFSKPRGKDSDIEELSPYQFRGSSKWYDNPDSLVTFVRCAKLPTPHESWTIKMRFTLRHGTSPDDIVCSVNEKDDGRVRYSKTVGGINAGRTKIPVLAKVEPIKPEQNRLMFNAG